MERILGEAAARGIPSASWILLRLPHEVAPLFREWLGVHYPDRAGKVMAIVQSVRGGRDYDSTWFTRMKPQGVWADLFRTRFRLACRRLGMNKVDIQLDRTAFRRPAPDGQLRLL
jgi:DNA repair photolyase